MVICKVVHIQCMYTYLCNLTLLGCGNGYRQDEAIVLNMAKVICGNVAEIASIFDWNLRHFGNTPNLW